MPLRSGVDRPRKIGPVRLRQKSRRCRNTNQAPDGRLSPNDGQRGMVSVAGRDQPHDIRRGAPIMHSAQKVAVVTGASQGIGAGLVRGFRQLGFNVVANSRSIKSRDLQGDEAILPVEGDIAFPETSDRIVSQALERFGRIDTLVNNAGIFLPKPFVDYSEADFVTMTSVNLAGFFHISKRVVLLMLEAGAGHIVSVTTT